MDNAQSETSQKNDPPNANESTGPITTPKKSPSKFTTDDYRVFVNNALAYYDQAQAKSVERAEHFPNVDREYLVGDAMLKLFDMLDKNRAAIAKALTS